MKKSKIILLYPPVGRFVDYNTPTGTLYVATILKENGYNVKFIDCSVETDYREKIMRELPDALCVGAYCMSIHIKDLLPLLEDIKRAKPSIKIMLGGPHPTLFPEATAKDELVDFVVRGEGEMTMLELVKALESNKKDFSGIKGICYKAVDKIISTPDREFLNMDSLPFVDWNFMSPLALKTMKERIARVQTSRGCPFKCAFCINVMTGNVLMRYRSPKKVVDEMEYLVKNFGVKRIGIRDEVFLTNKKQAKEIAEEIIKRGLKFTWIANPHVIFLKKNWIDDDFLILLVRSGCNKLQCGGESGSQRILDMLHKTQTPEDILNFVRRCKKYGIVPLVAILTALPGETKGEQIETLKLIKKILEIEPKSIINGPAMYRPYPGGELYEKCIKDYNLKMPDDLRGWMHLDVVGGPRPPWVKNLYFSQNLWTHVRLARLCMNGQLKSTCLDIIKKRGFIRGIGMALGVFIFAQISYLRMKIGSYNFPIEFWLLDIYWRIKGGIPEMS